MQNTNESFRGSQKLSSFFSYDKLHANDITRGGHRPLHVGNSGTIHNPKSGTRQVFGREGFMDDSKPTHYESVKLVNNDTLNQVDLKNSIKAENYGG